MADDDLKSWSKNDLVREVRRLREISRQVFKGGGRELTMESGTREDGKPFITMRWGSEVGQIGPDEARLHALRMLEVAEAAESDAVTVSFLVDKEFDEVGIASFLMMQRDWRERLKQRWREGHVPDE